MPKPRPQVENIRRDLDYDPETGEFRWKVSRPGVQIGKRAGSRTAEGYTQIAFGGISLRAGMVAWVYMTGEWPSLQVDHINCDRADDRWANLRLATAEQNAANKRALRTNTSGYKGVCYLKREGKWRAMLGAGRKHGSGIYLGMFDTPEEAHAAYVAKAREVYGEYARD